jgi:hypothetical protein
MPRANLSFASFPVRALSGALLLAAGLMSAGCTTTALVISAVSVATDTSITLDIVRHFVDKANDGQPMPCHTLDSVERALSPRCGAFVSGSIDARDVHTARMQTCPLGLAAQDVRLWPALPELIAKGAQPERCAESPLLRLAQRDANPDFAAASPAERQALVWLAEADARAIRHDVVRMLSGPNARAAGLDRVLDGWLASGALGADGVGFGVLGALHPDLLDSPLARALEAQGHTARAALGGHDGKLPSGYEAALRSAHFGALDWWLARLPELAQSVPPTQGDQLHWLPLMRVLTPTFVERPETQAGLVRYLIAHGASPGQRLPHDRHVTVKAYAKTLRSPLLALLDAPPESPRLAPRPRPPVQGVLQASR